jgi:hypothetical protein
VKRTLKALTVAATLTLPAVAGCSKEHQEANPPTNVPGPAAAPGTSEQPKVIDKPAPPTTGPVDHGRTFPGRPRAGERDRYFHRLLSCRRGQHLPPRSGGLSGHPAVGAGRRAAPGLSQ